MDEEPPRAVVDELRRIVEHGFTVQSEINGLERRLEALKKEHHKLLHELIPAKMQEVGTNVFGILGTNFECRISPYYHAVLKPDNKSEAIAWLDEHGHGDIVKTSLTVDFNREDRDAAVRLRQRLHQWLASEEINAVVKEDTGVHHMTLTAFVKHHVEEGEVLPFELLGATIGVRASFKEKK